MASGYTPCACRDCFEIAISNEVSSPDLCHACEEADCQEGEECEAPGAYGCDDDGEPENRGRAH